jgi:hypothetical protein
MKVIPPVVVRGETVVSVPKGFNPYGWQMRLVKLKHYDEVVAMLEDTARTGTLSDRFSAILAFYPSTAFERQFLNLTTKFRGLSPEHPDRLLAERALRALNGLALVPPARGRKPKREMSAVSPRDIRAARDRWLMCIRPLWRAAGNRRWMRSWSTWRARFIAALELAQPAAFPIARAYRSALSKLVGREWCRPSDVADQLTAWELNISVHHVRAALGAPPVARFA